jgi:hypothetical protein
VILETAVRWLASLAGVQLVRILIRTIPYLRQHVKALEDHNRLLIQAATESARKLQENTRLLTSAATESARSQLL